MAFPYTPRAVALALGVVSALALGFALVLQYGFGYPPCELCLTQRLAHDAVIAAALAALILKHPRVFLAAQAVALAIGGGYAVFHAGVEQHWWQGTEACVGKSGATTVAGLTEEILNAPVVRCDQVRWSLLGLSMAAWNAILCFSMAAFATAILGARR